MELGIEISSEESEEKFSQEWPVNNQTQTAERINFGRLVSDFLDVFQEKKENSAGRNVYNVKTKLFSPLVQTYTNKNSKRIVNELEEAKAGNLLEEVFHFISILNFYQDKDLPKLLCQLSITAKPLEKAGKSSHDSIDLIKKVQTFRDLEKKDEIWETSTEPDLKELVSESKPKISEKKEISINSQDGKCKVLGSSFLEELVSNLMENSITHSKYDEIRIFPQGEEKQKSCVNIKPFIWFMFLTRAKEED